MILKNLPLVSVVVTTKNEENNIANCLRPIINQTYPKEKVEAIVVDNYSSDNTIKIVKQYTKKIYNKGPQRATQLNFGVQKSKGKYILYLDADMIISKKVVMECVEKCENDGYIALYIPEKIIGNSYWISVRDFERSFYNATCIDAVRFVNRDTFLKVGGFDENLIFGPDDWDFDRRIKEAGRVSIINAPLYHNEGVFSIKNYLKKKSRYSKGIGQYIEKWGEEDPIIKKQLGIRYRLFDVFIEGGKWKKFIRCPLLAFGVSLSRFLVGIQYLRSRVHV